MDYRPENGGNEFQPPKKKKTKRRIATLVICIIVAAAIGTGAGVLAVSLNGATVTRLSNEQPHITIVPDVKPTEAPDTRPDTQPDAQPDTRPDDEPDAQPGGSIGSTIVDGSSEHTGEVLHATELYEKTVSACVGIKVDVTANVFGQVTSSAITGSGFIISDDGYILTNYHVVEQADLNDLEISVTLHNGDIYSATLIGEEDENDIALLKIDGKDLPALVLNTSGDLVVGQPVYVIGNPLGELTYTLTDGIVSALDRDIAVEANMSIRMFQISAAINSGNSGGPVFNDRGEVIGIASAKYSRTGVEGLGFAIPIEDAMAIIDDLIEYGYVRGKPYFGITVRTVTESVAEYYNWVVGAFVSEVDETSCAAVAGLKSGDIIVGIDDIPISSSSDLILSKKNYVAGDTATLEVFRNGEYLSLVITFDEEGADPFTGSVNED